MKFLLVHYLCFHFYLKDLGKSNMSGGGGITGSLMVLRLWCGVSAGPSGALLMVSLVPSSCMWVLTFSGSRGCSAWITVPTSGWNLASCTCYPTFGSPSPLQPLCGPEPAHSAAVGVSGKLWMIPARLNEPFIDPFQCLSCFRRAIIETPLSSQLWSTALPGGGGCVCSAPFHSDSCIRVHPSPRTRSHHSGGCCSRLPGWQRTGQTRAFDVPAFRGITAELRAPTERRNESARPVIVSSLANKPRPSPASELFRNLPHF